MSGGFGARRARPFKTRRRRALTATHSHARGRPRFKQTVAALLLIAALLWGPAPAGAATATVGPSPRYKMGAAATPSGVVYIFGGWDGEGRAGKAVERAALGGGPRSAAVCVGPVAAAAASRKTLWELQ